MDDLLEDVLKRHWMDRYDTYSANSNQISAMKEYALLKCKSESIAFCKWCSDNYKSDLYGYYEGEGISRKRISYEDLYEIFISCKSNNSSQ